MTNKILTYLLLALGIIFYFFPYRFKTFYLLMLISFSLALLCKYVVSALGLGEKEELLLIIMIWLNTLGELWFYFNYTFYDKILHYFVPIAIAYIYFQYTKKIDFFFPFTILGLLAFFEIFEWAIQISTGFPIVGVYSTSGDMIMDFMTDTMIDLILGFLGCLTFIIHHKVYKDNKQLL